MRPRRVIGYARVSSAEQALGTSLEDQQNAIRAHAKARGLTMAHIFVEAESAVHEKAERRVQMKALMADVRAGDLVLCDKIDRWSRDLEFTYTSMRELREKGAAVYFVGDACDPSTPEGDTMLNFRALFAREEHKRIKVRLVGTRKLLRDRGYYVEGLPPYGYRRSVLASAERRIDRNVLVVDGDRADVVRRIFKLCVSGKSLQQIADIVDLKRDRVRDVLHSRVYLGEIQDTRGEWIRGKHAPIIDAGRFQAAQDAIAGRRHAGARYRTPGVGPETSGWMLRDVAVCARCDARMGAAYAGDKGARRYYYRCTKSCTRRYVPVRMAEAEMVPAVVARLLALREDIARTPGVPTQPLEAEDFDAQTAILRGRRQRIIDAYQDGDLTRDDMRGRLERLDEMMLKVEAARANASRPDPLADAASRRAVLREVRTIEKVWAQANGEGRRQIVKLLAKAVRLEAGQSPKPDWRSASELAEEVRP